MKFEEHEGQLFRMLEEPVPLKEKDTNVLVQFITHGIIGEYVMEHWLDCGQENAPIFVDSVDSDGDVTVFIENGNEHICCPFPMFEIIGTPVAEGSAEWAMYQMMQGKKVCNPTLAAEKSTRLGSCEVEQFNTYWYVVGEIVVEGEANYGALSISSWISAAHPYGWQLYEPEPQYKVGDWVKYGIDSYLQVIEPSGKNRTTCRTPSGTIIYPYTSCLTKASPSEVVIHIGCMSGTVVFVDADRFILRGIGNSEMSNACIMFKMLDTQTLEIVESLLKAQEEEK